MKKRGLFSRIVVGFGTVLIVIMLILSISMSIWFKSHYEKVLRDDMKTASNTLNDDQVKYWAKNDGYQVVLKDLQFAADNIDCTAFFTTSKGAVHTALDDNTYGDLYNRSILQYNKVEQLVLTKLQDVFIQGSLNNTTHKEKGYIYFHPVTGSDGSIVSVVIFFQPLSDFNKLLFGIYKCIFGFSCIAGIIGLALIYVLSQKIVMDPLDEINNAAKKMAKGEVDRRIIINGNDEIAELGESFNTMANSLETVDKNRRAFISNVSHELRSPITSIKGFIDAILDGVVPKDKEDYYLKIVQDEIQRLTRLVNDLLDLSAMESGKFSMNITEVDIINVIKICITRCETRIKDKKLKVDVVYDYEHLYVKGDRDRLMQVVNNILDNAIKYVHESGYIKISVKTKGEKVLVTVYDNGPKISEEDLPHIWDRFYKNDKSRTIKVSTGLGLPIIRNIISQLGEDIWVECGTKIGVSFIFTLTEYKRFS